MKSKIEFCKRKRQTNDPSSLPLPALVSTDNNQSAFICDFIGSSDYEIYSEKKYAESIIKNSDAIPYYIDFSPADQGNTRNYYVKGPFPADTIFLKQNSKYSHQLRLGLYFVQKRQL